MPLPTVIIATTYFLGVALALCGVIAIFKKLQPGSGSFKFMGVELSGTGAILMLLVSLVLLMSGFGWAKSNSNTVACTKEKTEVVAEAKTVHEQLQNEVQLRQRLLEQIPATTKAQIAAQNPNLVHVAPVTLPPRLSTEIGRIASQRVQMEH